MIVNLDFLGLVEFRFILVVLNVVIEDWNKFWSKKLVNKNKLWENIYDFMVIKYFYSRIIGGMLYKLKLVFVDNIGREVCGYIEMG